MTTTTYLSEVILICRIKLLNVASARVCVQAGVLLGCASCQVAVDRTTEAVGVVVRRSLCFAQ